MTLSQTTKPTGREKTIAIIVPVYNEESAIQPFITRIEQALTALPSTVAYRIVFVNDGSTDGTEIVVQSLAARQQAIHFITLSRNFGKDAALAAAIDQVEGDALIPIDVDLQDPPELIPEMVRLWLSGSKIVNARRIDRSRDGWFKRQSARAFYRLFNAIADRPIPRDVGDFRLLDRDVVDVIRGLGERARFNKALFNWVGYDAEEVTFERPERAAGKSQWTNWKLWNYALDGIFSSSTVPLRIWGYLGLLLAMLSFLYAAFLLLYTIVGGRDTPGYASTVILVLSFGGLNMLALGIIGEYIGRIYLEVRHRPLYVIRASSLTKDGGSDGS